MKTKLMIFVAAAAGAMAGGAAVQGLHAQGKPPAFFVVEIRTLVDPDALKTIAAKASSSTTSLEALGGRYVIRTNEITQAGGPAPKRLVVIAFDSVEKARAWHESPEQKEIEAVRTKLTDSSSFVVEGLAN